MLFALCNLTSFEVLSQQNFVFPYTISESGNEGNLVVKDLKPTGLTRTATPTRFAHSFNANIRVFRETNEYDKIGGIFISDNETPQAQQARFYPQEYNIRLAPRTSFNDIAYIPKDALWRLYQRITTGTTNPIRDYISSLPDDIENDSIYSFIFDPPANPGDPPRPRTYGNVRPGLLIVAGQYTTLPDISCGGANPVRNNAAIYVIDAGSLQPLRMFKFFQCSGDVVESNFTAIRYLDIIDRFVTVGSCVNTVNNNNIDILSFSGDLLYLLWNNIPQTDAHTHRYNISEPDLGPSCNDIATGVDLRYFKKPSPQVGYYNNAGAIMISAYVTNSRSEEVSVLLRLNHDGTPHPTNPGRTKNAATNNRAHAVTFLTDDVGIWQEEPYELGVTGYIRVNQADNIYIGKFDQLAFAYADRRYFTLNNNATEKPGFSIVSTGDGYAVTGRYEPLNTNLEHLSYLRVDANLLPIEHSNFPFGTQSDSYGQRMRFTNGAGLMLGGTSTLFGIFNHCSCEATDPECNCTFEDPPCPTEWKFQTQSPITLTLTNSAECLNSIVTYSNLCTSSEAVCWLPMTRCIAQENLLKPRYDVCSELMENGYRAKLARLLGDVCKDDYCKTRVGNPTPPTP